MFIAKHQEVPVIWKKSTNIAQPIHNVQGYVMWTASSKCFGCDVSNVTLFASLKTSNLNYTSVACEQSKEVLKKAINSTKPMGHRRVKIRMRYPFHFDCFSFGETLGRILYFSVWRRNCAITLTTRMEFRSYLKYTHKLCSRCRLF